MRSPALLASLCFAACTGTIDGPGTGAGDVSGGSPIPPDCYPQMVELQNAKGQQCSGIVIGPGLVLTAGHCVAFFSYYDPPTGVETSLGQTVPVKSTYLNPAFNPCEPPYSDNILSV